MKHLLLVALIAGMAYAGEYRTLECRERECGNPHTWTDNMAPSKCAGTPEYSELLSAAEEVLPYLSAPSDDTYTLQSMTLEYRRPSTQLELAEKEVARLKEKDAAIKRFRGALNRAKEK